MNCFDCDRPAHGICNFCGRGVCKDHFKEDLYVQELLNSNEVEKNSRLRKYLSLVVEKSLKCSFCGPIEELVEISIELKEEG